MGKRQGHGTHTLADGDKYEGEWQDNRWHGSGTITWKSGGWYTGQFKMGERLGYGTQTFANGIKYEGEWQDGVAHGSGTMTWKSGAWYTGQYNMGMRHGHGTKTFADGGRYEGEWEDDQFEGKGSLILSGGETYEGDFKNHKRDGYGKNVWPNGDVYIGEFKNDTGHGKGKFTYASGKVVEGMFEDGVSYKERASYLKLELEALQLKMAQESGKEIDGLSMEDLKEIVSKNEENVRRVQQEIDWREARAGVASMDEYNCPLTLDLMEDPVVASDGYTYERTAIEKVIQVAKAEKRLPKSPKTNLPLEHTNLTPNRDLKSRICCAVDRVVLGKRQRDDGQRAVGAGSGKASRPS